MVGLVSTKILWKMSVSLFSSRIVIFFFLFSFFFLFFLPLCSSEWVIAFFRGFLVLMLSDKYRLFFFLLKQNSICIKMRRFSRDFSITIKEKRFFFLQNKIKYTNNFNFYLLMVRKYDQPSSWMSVASAKKTFFNFKK